MTEIHKWHVHYAFVRRRKNPFGLKRLFIKTETRQTRKDEIFSAKLLRAKYSPIIGIDV